MTATSSVETLPVGRSEPTQADTAHVLGLIGGYQVSQAVYAAAALKLTLPFVVLIVHGRFS